MNASQKRSVAYLLIISALLLFAYCLRFVFHPLTDNALWGISMMTLRWVIQFTLTVGWCMSLRRRILHTAIRRMLLSVGALLLFWQMVRIIKYDYVIITEPIGRYCWYAFYIAMVLVPLIGVFVTDHIGRPEGYHSPSWMKYLFIPAILLIAVVFSNDLHQTVFTFHNGFALYNSDYGYGPMYIVVMGWFIVLALLFVIRLMIKSRVPGSRSFQMLPLIIAVLAIAFWTGYSMKLYTGDLTAVDSLIIIMLLESAIQSGLIPSNMNYRALFLRSTIAAQIVDHEQNVKYASASAQALGREVMAQAMRGSVELGESVLHAQKIRGGHVLWQDDVRAINALTESLRDANELLGERYDLMKAELELKERRIRAEEKSRLYDRIAREIAARLNTVDELLEKSRKQPEQAKALLSQVCVISAYIKRRANLILLGEEKSTVSVRELESCLRESLDNLRLCGVLTYLDFQGAEQERIKRIIAVYDWFEDVTEMLLGHATAVVATVRCAEGELRLRIQAGCKAEMPDLSALSLAGGRVECEVQEEDLIIEASLGRGGERA